MPFDLQIVDPLSYDGWDKAVLEFEQASFFPFFTLGAPADGCVSIQDRCT